MQFIDLKAQQKRIRNKIEAKITEVLDHGQYIMGPEIAELEAKLASYAGVKHAVGCSSGTDALLLALLAEGVGPGDAVITSPFTFIATAEAVQLLGATPVFVDIDPHTFNLDPDLIEQAVRHAAETPGLTPKGIIGVDLFGLPADYDRINAIARRHALFVIEDAAQSFGARYGNRMAGSLGDIACTSFFPAKPLGCYGDGGMCFTDDDEKAAAMMSMRVHGEGNHRYNNVRIGINGRLDSIQAAVLLVKFDIFPEELDLRAQAADRYARLIEPIGELTLPAVPEGSVSAWSQYSILCAGDAHRSALRERLSASGIPTAVYYPKPLHRQAAFAHLGYRKGDFPISEAFSQRIVSLPMHPYLRLADQQRIATLLGA